MSDSLFRYAKPFVLACVAPNPRSGFGGINGMLGAVWTDGYLGRYASIGPSSCS